MRQRGKKSRLLWMVPTIYIIFLMLPTAAFFITIFLMLVCMGVWEYFSPGSNPRIGILRFETARCDRLFVSLLGSTFIHVTWLGLIGPSHVAGSRSRNGLRNRRITLRLEKQILDLRKPASAPNGNATLERKLMRYHILASASLIALLLRASNAFAGMGEAKPSSIPRSRTCRHSTASARKLECNGFFDTNKPFSGI